MHYFDKLYGDVEIRQDVLLELMTSNAMLRAKGVSQHGITALIGITPPFSRFDHSVGTMLLVRHLGATLEEQIAALLHDISHTAFSHVIDYVFDDHSEQNYHEERKKEFIAGTDIPEILHSHGFDWNDFMDEEGFSLLEQPSPALCADRLDYFFRDLEFLKLANAAEINRALETLKVIEGKIVVDTLDIARWMAYTYIEADQASWSNFREVGLYQVTAEAIKATWSLGLIEEADIWKTDEEFWEKLQRQNHPDINRWVQLISPWTRFTWNEEQPLFSVSTKVRTIDPPVITGDSVSPLSLLDLYFAKYREKYIASKQGPWPMDIVNQPHQ